MLALFFSLSPLSLLFLFLCLSSVSLISLSLCLFFALSVRVFVQWEARQKHFCSTPLAHARALCLLAPPFLLIRSFPPLCLFLAVSVLISLFCVWTVDHVSTALWHGCPTEACATTEQRRRGCRWSTSSSDANCADHDGPALTGASIALSPAKSSQYS